MPFRRTTVVALTAALLALSPTLAHAAPAKKAFKVTAAPSVAALPVGGGAVTVTGKVSPSGKKRPVSLQVAVGGGWVTIASARTDKKKATYVLTGSVTTAGANTLRVTTPKKGSRQAGTSAPFVVTVSAPAGGGSGGGGTPGSPEWKALAAGTAHSCGVTAAGAMKCWGSNQYKQLGNTSTSVVNQTPTQVGSNTDWFAVAAGEQRSCGLRESTGTAWCWGLGSPTVTQVGSDTGYVEIVAGADHVCARKSTGALYCWGYNTYGQLGNGNQTDTPTPTRVTTDGSSTTTWLSVSASNTNTCAVRSDSTAWCWGRNTEGQLGTGTTGAPQSSPQKIGTDTWSSIAAGYRHTCGRKSNGTLWCWGDNTKGQLGNGTTTANPSPGQVGSGTWAAVDSGNDYSCALTTAGTLWCWGMNTKGALGTNTSDTAAHPTPVQATNGTGWSSMDVGAYHSCGTRNNQAWCWGTNDNGMLGVSGGTSYSGPVAVGS